MATNVKTNAKTKDEVDQMSAKDRMWDSLSYSYGKKKEESDRSYDKAISQQDRALLQRGMQRSSYGMNTLGNLQNQKVNAGNDINSQLIADYENRLYQLDRDEIEDAFRREQFDETKRQFDENLGFQKSEAERAQGNWQKEYDANRADTTWSQNFQQAQADLQKEQWNKNFEANRADTAWSQQFQQAQADIQNEQWNKNFEAGREDTAWNQNFQQQQFEFQQQQWEKQQEQWREEFDYQKMSDRQKLLFSYIETALREGKDVSDALLAEVGMTRADFNAMASDAAKGGYGGSYGGKKSSDKASTLASTLKGTPTDTKSSMGGFLDAVDAFNGNNKDSSAKEPEFKYGIRQNMGDLAETTPSGQKAKAKVVANMIESDSKKTSTFHPYTDKLLQAGTKKFLTGLGK